jgi:hypothetical protein
MQTDQPCAWKKQRREKRLGEIRDEIAAYFRVAAYVQRHRKV